MNRLVLLLLALGFLGGFVAPSPLPAQNLVVNGSFDAGNTGFTTDYTFIDSGTSTEPGTFGLRATSTDFNPGYTAFTDHTGNGGPMMLVDGSGYAAEEIVWQETVPVSAGASYTFSAWATSADPSNPSTLRFLINGTAVGSDLALTVNSGVWQNFTAVWNAGSSTSATLAVVDTLPTAEGNDFALDDLSFTATTGGPPPADVASTFDTDADGWTLGPNHDPDSTLTYLATGGNPGGCVQFTDGAEGIDDMFYAPAKFLGNDGGYYNGSLTFQLQAAADVPAGEESAVTITDANGNALVQPNPAFPGGKFVSFGVALNENGGWTYLPAGATSGVAPTQAQFQAVLGNVASLQVNADYLNGTEQTLLDNVLLSTTSIGTVQFASAAANTTENAGSVALTVQRTGGSVGTITVDYATGDGTALAGTDYTATSGTLTWADGDTADKMITVPLTDRSLYDGSTKTFTVTLANATGGAALGTPVSASVNVLDNDAAPQPTVAIASPINGATFVVGQSVPFAASVTDPGGILSAVTFAVNGTQVYQSTGHGPFVTTVDTTPFPPDDYVVTAAVVDNQGRTNSSTVTVHLIAATAGVNPPGAAVLTPLLDPSGQPRNLPAGITITVSFTAASADGTPLQKASLYADGVLVAAFDGAGNPVTMTAGDRPVRRAASAATGLDAIFQTPYTLPATDKIVNLVAVALDALGHSTVSSVASIHATVTSDQAPVLALSGLASGTHVKVGSVNPVSVSASDPDTAGGALAGSLGRQDVGGNATLAKLEYYINGAFDHMETQPPFDFNFSPSSPGKFELDVVATDGSGLATLSAPLLVDVDAPPAVSVATGAVAVEGGAKGVVMLTRTGDAGAALTVAYKVVGSAVAGVDYKKPGGTVTFAAGVSRVKLKLKTLADPAAAGTRVAKVKLLPAADGSYSLGTVTVAKVKIIDND